MYACTELFCVLTNVSNKFVFRRFPLRGVFSPLNPPACAPWPLVHYITFSFSQPVAYLGFPAPGDKLSFGAPTQPVRGSIDVKNELEIKGRRKLTRALHSPAYNCFYTRLKTFCD